MPGPPSINIVTGRVLHVHLFASKDQPLLHRRNAFFLLNPFLYPRHLVYAKTISNYQNPLSYLILLFRLISFSNGMSIICCPWQDSRKSRSIEFRNGAERKTAEGRYLVIWLDIQLDFFAGESADSNEGRTSQHQAHKWSEQQQLA